MNHCVPSEDDKVLPNWHNSVSWVKICDYYETLTNPKAAYRPF